MLKRFFSFVWRSCIVNDKGSRFRLTFLLIALALMLSGCASTLTLDPAGTITASDYSITTTTDKNGTRITKAAPNRWFATQFLSDFFKQIAPIISPVVSPLSGDAAYTVLPAPK